VADSTPIERDRAFREPVRQRVGEPSRLREVMLFQVGRRDPHAEIALAILAGTEVADQGQQRPQLSALVSEMDTVEEDSAQLGPKPLDRLESCASSSGGTLRRPPRARWSSTLAATSDSRNDRIGTFVDSHHVGDRG